MKVAILIPCYNEELTIGKVISDFKKSLPEADIFVYDNNSIDKTAEIAKNYGATVIHEFRQGKGNVVKSMFSDIEADYYIMVDGDDTYPAEFAYDLLRPLLNNEADMTIGDRLSNGTYLQENKRLFHNFGNNLVKKLIDKLFHSEISDIMTGYRAFNKYFVKNIPILSSGFEIETEMTIHALDKKFLIKEVPIIYRDRPEGSVSKLNTYKDGVRVIKTIISLFKDYNPLTFFSIGSAIFFILGLIAGIPVITEFINTRFIAKFPSALLATGLMLICILLLLNGFVLDTQVKNYRQNYELRLIDYKQKEQRK